MPKTEREYRRWLVDELHHHQMLNRMAAAELRAGRCICRVIGYQLTQLPTPKRRR